MSTEKTVLCYKCQHPLDIEAHTKILRSDVCSACKTSLRCCRMCLHYEPSSYNECRESIAERIIDKEKFNFCDYFVFDKNNSNKPDHKNKFLNAANSLFKN